MAQESRTNNGGLEGNPLRRAEPSRAGLVVCLPQFPAKARVSFLPPCSCSRSCSHGLRRRRGGGQVAERRVAGVPVLPGPVDAARDGPLGGHARRGGDLRAPGLHGPRLLHRQLRPRDLPPQPPHRLPFPHGRPGARPLRRRRRRAGPPHPRLRRVQAIHPPPPRVQVLVCNHKSFCCSFCDDFFLCIRCSGLLAYTSLLLDRTLRPDNEAPDSAYGQVQICTFQYREAEIWREEGWRKQQFFKRLIPSLPWWEEWKGEKIQSMLFHVLNTKCNTPFISRVRRMFSYVSDLGSRFNLIFVLECFLISVYSVILLSNRRSVRLLEMLQQQGMPQKFLVLLLDWFMYHVYAPSFTC